MTAIAAAGLVACGSDDSDPGAGATNGGEVQPNPTTSTGATEETVSAESGLGGVIDPKTPTSSVTVQLTKSLGKNNRRKPRLITGKVTVYYDGRVVTVGGKRQEAVITDAKEGAVFELPEAVYQVRGEAEGFDCGSADVPSTTLYEPLPGLVECF